MSLARRARQGVAGEDREALGERAAHEELQAVGSSIDLRRDTEARHALGGQIGEAGVVVREARGRGDESFRERHLDPFAQLLRALHSNLGAGAEVRSGVGLDDGETRELVRDSDRGDCGDAREERDARGEARIERRRHRRRARVGGTRGEDVRADPGDELDVPRDAPGDVGVHAGDDVVARHDRRVADRGRIGRLFGVGASGVVGPLHVRPGADAHGSRRSQVQLRAKTRGHANRPPTSRRPPYRSRRSPPTRRVLPPPSAWS